MSELLLQTKLFRPAIRADVVIRPRLWAKLDEVICDAAKASARARQLIPNFEGELVPQCRHEMSFSQYRIVDERVLKFLNNSS